MKIYYYFKILFNRIFGIKFNKDKIPFGMYCYGDICKKYKDDGTPYIEVNTCPYFKRINSSNTVCLYMGFIGFDPGHYDQCKICGENYGDEEPLEKT